MFRSPPDRARLAGRALRALLVFAGLDRFAAIEHDLKAICDESEVFLNVTEVNLLAGDMLLRTDEWMPGCQSVCG